MIGLSPPRRAAAQRVVFPLLVVLSALLIFLGKADQLMFESLRTRVADAAVPILDALSRPLVALGDVVHDLANGPLPWLPRVVQLLRGQIC